MTRIEKLACVWMGRHLEFVRHRKRLTAAEIAHRLGMRVDKYRCRELGRVPITLSFLLRVQLALNVHIEHLWFPFREGIDTPDEPVIESAMYELLELMCPTTVEQVLEVTAQTFQVPVNAVCSGHGRKRLRQARTAAALVVESIPHLRLTDLARLVCRPSTNWERTSGTRLQSSEGRSIRYEVSTGERLRLLQAAPAPA